jgi:hypothetical protein
VCCLYQIGSALSSVSMAPLVIVCSCRRGAPTVFKSVLHVLDATLDKPRHGNADPPAAGAKACTVSTQGGAVCVRGFCVILSVLPVSDWVCAAQCQHGTSGDCV